MRSKLLTEHVGCLFVPCEVDSDFIDYKLAVAIDEYIYLEIAQIVFA